MFRIRWSPEPFVAARNFQLDPKAQHVRTLFKRHSNQLTQLNKFIECMHLFDAKYFGLQRVP
jgi:hypothetical protein